MAFTSFSYDSYLNPVRLIPTEESSFVRSGSTDPEILSPFSDKEEEYSFDDLYNFCESGDSFEPDSKRSLSSLSTSKESPYLKHYQDESVSYLGQGSYGQVILVKRRYCDSPTRKVDEYALKKFIDPRTFLKELTIFLKFPEHPHIVKLVHEKSRGDMILMEKCEHSLAVYSFSENRLDFVQKVAKDVLSGLSHLLEHGIVHADIKPDNLLRASSGDIKICDFSSSVVLPSERFQKRHIFDVGTVGYRSPEMLFHVPYEDNKQDMWALGCTLYELRYGRKPFLLKVTNLSEVEFHEISSQENILGRTPNIVFQEGLNFDLKEKIKERDAEICTVFSFATDFFGWITGNKQLSFPVSQVNSNLRGHSFFESFVVKLLNQDYRFRSCVNIALNQPFLKMNLKSRESCF